MRDEAKLYALRVPQVNEDGTPKMTKSGKSQEVITTYHKTFEPKETILDNGRIINSKVGTGPVVETEVTPQPIGDGEYVNIDLLSDDEKQELCELNNSRLINPAFQTAWKKIKTLQARCKNKWTALTKEQVNFMIATLDAEMSELERIARNIRKENEKEKAPSLV